MTFQEQVSAVAEHGFTERQASFVVMVLLYAGVCVPRQYWTFAGISRGQVSSDLFSKLLEKRFATMYTGGANGRPVFHLHHKALYRAIGEPDSRFRKRGTLTRGIERLMVLDAVLAKRELAWFATETQKVEFCVHRRGLATEDLPSATFEGAGHRTVRYFPDKLPIGVTPHGDEVVLLYVATERSGQAFRGFLDRHEPLLRRLTRWRVVVALPRTLTMAEAAHRHVFNELCGAPLRPAIVDEFRWFCGARRAHEAGARVGDADPARYARARQAFGAPRFYSVYRRWCREGDGVLNRLLTPAFHDAWRRGSAALEISVLPYVYGEIGPLARTA
jgi:hypothetical protein